MDLEKIKDQLINHEERISELESLLKTKKMITGTSSGKSPPAEVLRLVISQLNTLKLSELAIIALKFHEKLTREEIIKILKKWRKKGADSLRSGNFSRDLIRTGFVTDGGRLGKEIAYVLTEDGKIEFDNIINKMRTKSEK